MESSSEVSPSFEDPFVNNSFLALTGDSALAVQFFFLERSTCA